MDKYDCLKLDNQLCFPLYVCSKEIVRRYKPFLDDLDITYTQYITLMALWEKGALSVKELGKQLFLDSGTLTPLLKTLEAKGYVARTRAKDDERNLIVSLTDEGLALRDRAVEVPAKMGSCINIKPEDAADLYRILHTMMDAM